VAHCRIMGHSTVSCAKMAEPMDMPLWMNTLVGPRNHILDWLHVPQQEGAIFGGFPGHSEALAIFTAAVAAAFDAEGISQSPVTSCSRRDHSVCQASANRNPENYERR